MDNLSKKENIMFSKWYAKFQHVNNELMGLYDWFRNDYAWKLTEEITYKILSGLADAEVGLDQVETAITEGPENLEK